MREKQEINEKNEEEVGKKRGKTERKGIKKERRQVSKEERKQNLLNVFQSRLLQNDGLILHAAKRRQPHDN